MNRIRNPLPVLAQKVAKREERRHPKETSRPGESNEGREAELRRTGHDGCEVPHAGDIVADEERPMTDTIEPLMHALEALLGDVEIFSEPVHRAKT